VKVQVHHSWWKSASRTGGFIPGVRDFFTVSIRSLVTPAPVWTLCSRGKPIARVWNWTPAVQPVPHRYTDRAISVLPHLLITNLTWALKRYNFPELKKTDQSYPCERPCSPVDAPFSRQSAHRWRWGRQPYSPAVLYPQEDSRYSFC
jgi:hypothetical protein